MGRPRLPIGAHGDINIVQVQPGKWRARTLYRFEDGKRRQVERFAPTKAKAQNALLEALTTIKAPEGNVNALLRRGMSVKALALAFLEVKFAEPLSPNTKSSYSGSATGIIIPALGSLAVDEVRPLLLQEFINKVIAANGPGQAYNCRKVLNGMFDLARMNSIIAVNPVTGVKVKSKELGKRAAKPLLVTETEVFVEACRANHALVEADIVDAWEFMSYVGCRIAETFALRWSHVDFEASTVHLGPSVMEPKGAEPYIYETSKSDASDRTIKVPQRAMDILRRRRESVVDTKEGLVFPHPLGKLYLPTRVAQIWSRQRAKVGYPKFTSHGFRKTVATMLDKAHMSARDIADYLGHKRPSFTQDVYMGRGLDSTAAAEALDAMFGVSSGSEGEDDLLSA